MGEHIDNRKGKKKKFNEGSDKSARHTRVSFKNYLRQIEEELIEDELEDDGLDTDNNASLEDEADK